MKGEERPSKSSLGEKLEGEMVNVNGTVGRVQSEFGEKPPCRGSFDYYVMVLEDCNIEDDDGEKFRMDALKARCSKERYEDCKDFLEKGREISLRGKVKGEGEQIQELTRLEERRTDSTERTISVPKDAEREPNQSITIPMAGHGEKKEESKSTGGTPKRRAKEKEWPDVPPPPGFEEDFRSEERKALEWGELRIPRLFRKESQNFLIVGASWSSGRETPMFKEAKEKILKADMTPKKYCTLELMASRWVPTRDPKNLNKRDGVGLEEVSEEIPDFPNFPHKDYRGIIDKVLKPLQRSGFSRVFDPPTAEYKRNAITKKGLRFLYPKIPCGRDESGKKKVTTGLIHRLRVCGGARVLARKGFFFYPVFHWASKHEFGEWNEPDGFAIPPAWTWRSVEDSWVWSRALWVEVLGEPIRREKIRANVKKNIKQNRRTLFLATSLENGKKIAEESRSVLEKMTPRTNKGGAEGRVTVGTREIAPRDYVVIQPIPPILPGPREKGEFKEFRQKKKIAEAMADGRKVKITNVDEEEYLKAVGIGKRSNEYVKIEKPDGQWTTVGKSDIVIEGFIKSAKEGEKDLERWLGRTAPKEWLKKAFLLEMKNRKDRQKFDATGEKKIRVGGLTFDRDEVEKELAKLTRGEVDFNKYVYQEYKKVSDNRGV